MGAIRVEVIMKKMRSRKTISVMDAMLKLMLTLFLERIATVVYYFVTGSFKRSINSVELASSLLTIFSTRATR